MAREVMVMVVMVVVILGRLGTPLLLHSVSQKVTPSFPLDVFHCLLGQVSLRVASISACALLCLQTPACRLYCLKDRECWQFSAQVTERWEGDESSAAAYDKCYSTWYYPGDITHFIVGTWASSYYKSVATANKAVDGFVCKTYKQCFHSNEQNGASWWRADLGVPRRVVTILVQTRRDGYGDSNFDNVVITLGNSTDCKNNLVFATYPSKAHSGDLLTFTPSSHIIGRYLQFDTNANKYLLICEVRIIS